MKTLTADPNNILPVQFPEDTTNGINGDEWSALSLEQQAQQLLNRCEKLKIDLAALSSALSSLVVLNSDDDAGILSAVNAIAGHIANTTAAHDAAAIGISTAIPGLLGNDARAALVSARAQIAALEGIVQNGGTLEVRVDALEARGIFVRVASTPLYIFLSEGGGAPAAQRLTSAFGTDPTVNANLPDMAANAISATNSVPAVQAILIEPGALLGIPAPNKIAYPALQLLSPDAKSILLKVTLVAESSSAWGSAQSVAASIFFGKTDATTAEMAALSHPDLSLRMQAGPGYQAVTTEILVPLNLNSFKLLYRITANQLHRIGLVIEPLGYNS